MCEFSALGRAAASSLAASSFGRYGIETPRYARQCMATLKRFARCKISIYADDHPPPHFHIEGRGFRVVVEIETLQVRAGDVRRAKEAMDWASDNIGAASFRMGPPKPEGMTVEAPNIKQIRPEPGNVLVIGWKGGAESTVDLSGYIGIYAMFAPLRSDEQAFGAVSVGEWGWSAHWTHDMEIAADTLWRLRL